MSEHAPRLAELLAAEAANDLDEAERAELAQRLPDRHRARDEMMRVAALVQLACLKREHGPGRALPAGLRERLAGQGADWLARRRTR